jgi:hypothetical protein
VKVFLRRGRHHARPERGVGFSSTPDELFLELDENERVFVPIESPEEVKAADERLHVAEAASDATSKEIGEASRSPKQRFAVA